MWTLDGGCVADPEGVPGDSGGRPSTVTGVRVGMGDVFSGLVLFRDDDEASTWYVSGESGAMGTADGLNLMGPWIKECGRRTGVRVVASEASRCFNTAKRAS